MRNGAGTHPPSSSGVNGFGCRQPGGSPAGQYRGDRRRVAGDGADGAAVAVSLAVCVPSTGEHQIVVWLV
jgi:hypothetical protein